MHYGQTTKLWAGSLSRVRRIVVMVREAHTKNHNMLSIRIRQKSSEVRERARLGGSTRSKT